MSRMHVATPLSELTEDQFRFQAIGTVGKPGLARTYGFECYHTLRSRGSAPGYPDWTLARPGDRIMFVELKKMAGKLSDHQKHWLKVLLDSGGEVYVLRPDDLQDFGRMLAHRGGHATMGGETAVARDRLIRKLHIGIGIIDPNDVQLELA